MRSSSRLDLLEPARLGAERVEKRAQVGRGLAQAKLDVAQLVAGARELGRKRLERRDGALGEPGQARRSFTVLRRERLYGRCRTRDELLEVAEPLALLAQLALGSRLEPVRVLDERAQLVEALGSPRSAFRKLLVTASSRQQLAPRGAQLATKLAVLRERVEHVELERRPRESSLLKLPGHREQPAPRRRRRPRGPQRVPTRRRACVRP